MAVSEFDDTWEKPVLKPITPVDSDREDFRDPPPRQGFGFWMAVVWCLAYMVVMQVIAGIIFGVPAVLIVVAIKAANGQQLQTDPKRLMEDEVFGPALMGILIGCHLAGLFFGWLLLRWQCGGKKWKRRIALSRTPSLTHCALVLIGFPALLAVSSALEIPVRELPTIQDLLDKARIDFSWPGIEAVMPLIKSTPLWLGVLAVAIVPALNEEFWCRGFLAQGLSSRYATWAVVLITSFLFGCLHMEPRQGFGAMLLGAAIHGAYLATRSLWVAIAVHAANNGVAVIHENQAGFPILSPFEDVLVRGSAEVAVFFLVSLFLLTAVGFALWQTRCKLVSTIPGLEPWQPEGGGMELPPPKSPTVVAHEPLSATSGALIAVAAIGFGLMITCL